MHLDVAMPRLYVQIFPQLWLTLCSASFLAQSVPLIRSPNLHISEPRRRRAVPCAHGLHGLAFAAVWSSPQSPLITRADRVHRVPELGRDSRIRRILDHTARLAAF